MDTVERFITDGYCRIEQAFTADLAARCRELLWKQVGFDPDDPTTWTSPVVRLGEQTDPLFAEAANTPALQAAYDALVGPGRWLPRGSLGTFPVRFPSAEEPGDDGWHLDASFPGDDPTDYFGWRINSASRGRALLMLFLFSDITDDDAPTRVRTGSHRVVADLLAGHGDQGLTMMELSRQAAAATSDHEVALASGRAGDVYLCHPFLVHAAQPHHGSNPRFLAQPALLPRGELDPVSGTSPVEVAMRTG